MRIRWQFLTLPVLAGAVFTPALASPLPKNASADRVVVYKAKRELELWSNGKLLKRYKVALGGNPVGHKEREGDQRTPEGVYTIDSRNAASRYHKSLHVSYPNTQDREHAKRLGVSPGGAIMVHGLPKGWGWVGAGHRATDWTLGCIAVTNEEIEEIWAAVRDGTPIEIKP
jgi:murein L,D-transpeptidase YafK